MLWGFFFFLFSLVYLVSCILLIIVWVYFFSVWRHFLLWYWYWWSYLCHWLGIFLTHLCLCFEGLNKVWTFYGVPHFLCGTFSVFNFFFLFHVCLPQILYFTFEPWYSFFFLTYFTCKDFLWVFWLGYLSFQFHLYFSICLFQFFSYLLYSVIKFWVAFIAFTSLMFVSSLVSPDIYSF